MSSQPDAPRTRNPVRTREGILDAAHWLVLETGFGATTVDAVAAKAGITKGAFFHHFASKSDLARALVERHAATDRAHFTANKERAQRLSADPLQQVLLFIGLYEEDFNSLDAPYPGCLFASFIYEQKLFEDATVGVLREAALTWRREMKEMLEKVAATYPPRMAVDLESLADLFYALTEGSFIMTKTLADKTLLARHATHLRNYLQLLFGRI